MNFYKIEIYTSNGLVIIHIDAATSFCARVYAERYIRAFLPAGTLGKVVPEF